MATFSDKPWGSISESDYASPEAFCSACLIDMNEGGGPKTKDKCKLPIKEPGGAVNMNGMRAAAAALAGARGGVNAPAEMKRMAAKKLMRMMGEAKMEPPESMRRMAGMGG